MESYIGNSYYFLRKVINGDETKRTMRVLENNIRELKAQGILYFNGSYDVKLKREVGYHEGLTCQLALDLHKAGLKVNIDKGVTEGIAELAISLPDNEIDPAFESGILTKLIIGSYVSMLSAYWLGYKDTLACRQWVSDLYDTYSNVRMVDDLVLTIVRTFNTVIHRTAILDKVLCETVHVYHASMPSVLTQVCLDEIKNYVNESANSSHLPYTISNEVSDECLR